jgi:hypothetical protein
MAQFPRVINNKFRVRTFVLKGIVAVANLAIPITMIIISNNMSVFEIALWTILIVGVIVVNIADINQLRRWENLHEPSGEPTQIVNWARGLYNQLLMEIKKKNQESDSIDLRITVHRVVKKRRYQEAIGYQQITNYIGGKQSGLGRMFPVRMGIIGLVERYRSPYAAVCESDDPSAFQKEMVQAWGYNWDEAKALTPDRKSWHAVPITDGKDGPVIGIVYCDSVDRSFFDPNIQETVIEHSKNLAEIVSREYNA